MNELLQIVIEHGKKYPVMQPDDAVKLVYQNEFGGGHFIQNPNASLLRLKEEQQRAASVQISTSALEELGNKRQRFYLAAADPVELPMECLNELFIRSSAVHTGTKEGLTTKLEILRQAASDGYLPFSPGALDEFLVKYQADGFPAISHSAVYKKAYHPAYRVLHRDYTILLPVLFQVNRLLKEKQRVTIALEGNAAAGKSTLAGRLAELYDANVIHMDDFFLPPSMRTAARYQEPGGNVHYERFQEEVLAPLAASVPFTYRVFDCHSAAYSEKKAVSPKALNIIERVYAMNPHLHTCYDLCVFVDISPEEQARRIIERNGPELSKRFQELWIPLENRYFDAYHIKEHCNIILST